MMELHPKDIGGIYIHDVFTKDNATPKSSVEEREKLNEQGVHVTDT